MEMIILVVIVTNFFALSEGILSCETITGPMVIADNKTIDLQAEIELPYYMQSGLRLGFIWQAGKFVIEGFGVDDSEKTLVIRDLKELTQHRPINFPWRTHDYFFLLGQNVEDLHLYVSWIRPMFGKIHKFFKETQNFQPIEMSGWETNRGSGSLIFVDGKHCLIGGATVYGPGLFDYQSGVKTAVLCYDKTTNKWKEHGFELYLSAAPAVALKDRLYACSIYKVCHDTFLINGISLYPKCQCDIYSMASGNHLGVASSHNYETHLFRMYTTNNEVRIVGLDIDQNYQVSDCTLGAGYPRCVVFSYKTFQGLILPCASFDDQPAV